MFLGNVLLALLTAWCDAEEEKNTDANRLTFLDESDPFYPDGNFPKLVTPQWVGDPEIEAVVILAIDDMRDPTRYENYLRPILERLKRIDGRAPVSIMVNAVNPTNAHLQSWLKEGLSLDVHTLAHPCPCLANGNFENAVNTYHGCVDLLSGIPGNKPVAFRMPCCDSMNSPSPRFYAEIFNGVSAESRFLTIDSSVMNVMTSADKTLPRELVLDANGVERFRKYLPAETNATTRVSMKSFVTTIENYPYPYVIGKLCWEFPAMAPSDWEAQNIHGVNSPITLADWKAALEATVLKQGVFTFIFHPHGWIRAEQMVEFIDYAVRKHGRKVKFLNFREAQERIDRHLLAGNPLRAGDGQDKGVRLLDINNDGFMDVVIGNAGTRKTRVWNPQQRTWMESAFPTDVSGVQFGVLHSHGRAMAMKLTDASRLAWHFDGEQWREDIALCRRLEVEGKPLLTIQGARDRGLRLRDVDNDGRCEVIVGNESQNAVFGWSEEENSWKKLPYSLPRGTSMVDAKGAESGARFVDINSDGHADLLFSNDREFSLHLFVTQANPRLMWRVGWNDEVFAGWRDQSDLNVPRIVRGGTNRNNGVWFRRNTMWIQNEDTAHFPDKVDRRTFRELLNADDPKPMSPEKSLAAIKVGSGFQVELVAAEPLVRDPIAFDWSADGRLWVVEMGDYPSGIGSEHKPGGTVRILEDTDGDGRYDKSSAFLDGLKYPTGLIPWRKGIIVAAAPDIFYAEDSDGDGKADERRVLFTGFGEGNPQHLVNGFEYGLDNWIYGANGDSGGDIKVAGNLKHPSVALRGRDFRFRPDEKLFEAVAGQTQYGRHRDDWGNWFGNNNPTWLWHYAIPEHYLTRNPHLVVKNTKRVLADYPGGTRLFPASRTRQRFNDHHQFNHVTSANSPTPYRDELFGRDFATSVFISDPVHNLVHREILEPAGVTFRSHRAPEEAASEFLASTDNWFRPTMLKTGPEGALYIADMYRLVLEHPEWIPDFIEARLDLRGGADMGRIYRVYPSGVKLRPIPRLDQLDTAALVAGLDHANGWHRDTAQRLLREQGDSLAAPALMNLVTNSSRPKTRLQALWTLDGLKAAHPDILLAALQDADPFVREAAVQMSEPFLRELSAGSGRRPPAPADGSLSLLSEALLERTDDPEVRVRYQLAFSLGELSDARAGEALATLALRDSDQDQVLTAVLSSAPRHIRQLLRLVFEAGETSPPSADLVARLVGLAAAQHDEAALLPPLVAVSQGRNGQFALWQMTALAGFLDALDRQGVSLPKFRSQAGIEMQTAVQRLSDLFGYARGQADASWAIREAATAIAATRLLGRGLDHRQEDLRRLHELLRPQIPPAVQTAALAALKQHSDANIGELLLQGWRGYGPALREEVGNVLLSRQEWTSQLLEALQSERLSPSELGPLQQQKLLTHSQKSLRDAAAKIFAVRADRHQLLDDYRKVAGLAGDAAKGKEIYRANCSPCHRFQGEGQNVGPELAALVDKPLEALLVAILDPNQAVEWRYVNYQAVTSMGHEISGIIVAETPTSITLQTASGREETLLRSDLANFESTKLSLMPEGFEQALKPQDMADLIVFLRKR